MAAVVDGGHQGGRVVLEGPRGEADVTDLGRRGPAIVLAVVEALDLALDGLVDVETIGVEEADDHRLRVGRVEAHGDAALVLGGAYLEPRDGHRRQLEVVDVDPTALSPVMRARLKMRAARLESREATTVLPFLSVVPKAMASLSASSGLMSTLASPATP